MPATFLERSLVERDGEGLRMRRRMKRDLARAQIHEDDLRVHVEKASAEFERVQLVDCKGNSDSNADVDAEQIVEYRRQEGYSAPSPSSTSSASSTSSPSPRSTSFPPPTPTPAPNYITTNSSYITTTSSLPNYGAGVLNAASNDSSPSASSSSSSSLSFGINFGSNLTTSQSDSSSSNNTTSFSQYMPPLNVIVGIAVGVVILVVSGISLCVWCRVRKSKRRRLERHDARDMRERGRQDGQGHFDLLPDAQEGVGNGTGTGTGESRVSLVPPSRAFLGERGVRAGPGIGMGMPRHASLHSMSTGNNNSRWEDDLEADMVATDGSSLARTLSSRSQDSAQSNETVRDRDVDHPGYTYRSVRPGNTTSSGSGSGSGTYMSGYGNGSTTLLGSGSVSRGNTLSTSSRSPFADPSSPSPFRDINTASQPQPAAHLSDVNTRARSPSRLSILSTSSAGLTAISEVSGVTRTTLPEYSVVNTSQHAIVHPHSTTSPFADPASVAEGYTSNPFDDPTLPRYEGVVRGQRGQRRETLASLPPAYAER